MAIYHGLHKTVQLFQGMEINRAYTGSKRVFPDAAPQIQWIYSADNNSAALHLYLGKSPFVSIPASIAGIPVTALSPTALCGQKCTKVTIPASVKLLA